MRISVKTDAPYVGMRTKLNLPDRGSAEKYYYSYTSYLFRAYIAYKKLVDFHREHGYGFGLFETLTYRNKDLPLFEGLPCFSGRHITLFFKRLRTNLERKLGHRPVIDFILVCEYGDEKQRPHYHPLFFVYEKISPYEFAKFVYEAWQYGKTDSYDVYGRPQFATIDKHVIISFAACRYILKYILKYIEFENKFSSVLDKLFSRYNVEDEFDLRDRYMYECRPFIRTSLNFGYTSQFDNSEDLTINIPTDGFGNFEIVRCPSYVYRKLFYDKQIESYSVGGKPIYRKTPNGSYMYELNDLGREYKARNIESCIDAAVALYNNVLSSLNQYELDRFNEFLADRSLRDLAIYSLVYRDRLFVINPLTCEDFTMPFDTVVYTKFFLDCLECRQLKVTDFSFTIDDRTCELFNYFDFLLDFIDQLVHYQHVELHTILDAVEVYNNLSQFQFTLNYEDDSRLCSLC